VAEAAKKEKIEALKGAGALLEAFEVHPIRVRVRGFRLGV